MALYIKPPTGNLSYNKLYSFVMKRLVFLHYINGHSVDDVNKVIERETLAENSDCLIEGTAKDKISHFTLRLLCSSDYELQDFFIQAEIKLFRYRLQFCDFHKLRQMLQKASTQSRVILLNSSYLLNHYRKTLKSLVFATEEIENAIKERRDFINVPFTSALNFVAERLYPLHLGFLSLPLIDLKSYLTYMFHELLLQGMKQMRMTLNKELEDSRMCYLYQKVKKWLQSNYSYSSIINGKRFLHGCNLIEESTKFPLCMSSLFNQLLTHHRLRHTSRIQLTLFLKEIGVPANDVIKLFMKEYSMPVVTTCELSHGHCSHNWSDSEKRYIYSIEHLYGLRGSHKNYKAHSCESLQSTCSNDGGCPFVTFDNQHLQRTLEHQNLVVKDIEDIITLANQKNYNTACCSYLHFKVYMHLQKRRENILSTPNQPETHNDFADADSSTSNNFTIHKTPQLYHVTSPIFPKKIKSPSDFYSVLSY